MSLSTNKKSYDDLLDKFLGNNRPLEGKESKEMERWLNEATNNLRLQSQQYRGKAIHWFLSFDYDFHF